MPELKQNPVDSARNGSILDVLKHSEDYLA